MSTRRRRRLIVTVSVLAATFLACVSTIPGLTTTTQPMVVSQVTPSTNFGDVQIGATSSAITITIAPASGENDDYIDGITYSASCGDFTLTAVSPATLPPPSDHVYYTCPIVGSGTNASGDPGSGTASFNPVCDSASATFSVVFQPTVSGTASCQITFVMRGTITPDPVITLSGNGLALPHQIDVQPTDLTFGQVRTTTTSGQVSSTVRNAGSQPLAITSAAFTANPSNVFAVTPPAATPYSIPFQGAPDYQFTCSPSVAGMYTGTYEIVNDSTNAPTVDLTLHCEGVDSNLGVAPSPIQFATARVGEPPPLRSVRLENFGGTSILVSSVTLANATGLTLGSFNPVTLVPTAHVDVIVSYDAASAHSGLLGQLVVAASVAGVPITVPSTNILGDALLTSMSASMSTIDFGAVCANTTPPAVSVGIYAGGPGWFVANTVGQPAAPFSRTAPKDGTGATATLPFTLDGSHGNDLTFDVAVTPTVPNDYTDKITIATDIPGAQHDLDVMLHVNVLPGGQSATPSMLDYGSTNIVGTPSTVQMAKLTNCSDSDLVLDSADIVGLDPTDFAVILTLPTEIPITVPPKQAATVGVVMSARTRGIKAATLDLHHANGVAEVALAGAASGGPDPGAKDRETYYGCSTGRGDAAWPIGLALLALRRRRRWVR